MNEKFCRNCVYCIWDDIGEGFGYCCELAKEEFDYDDGYCEEYDEQEVSMGLLLPTSELPKSCSDCPLYDCDAIYCNAHPSLDLNYCDVSFIRHKACPLIEVDISVE